MFRTSMLALLVVQVSGWAQPVALPPDRPVAELIASSVPQDQAWGAYLAAGQGLKTASRELLQFALSDDWRVRLAAMDSLIRLEVAIPKEVLEKMVARRLDEPLIFIARNLRAEQPEDYWAVIESLLAKPDIGDGYWVALNSILLAKPPAGYAARLLRDWTIQTTLIVDDSGSGWVGTPGLGAVAADGTGYSESGFPPLFQYFVFENPGAGDALLAGGPHAVGYHRQASSSQMYYQRNRDEYRRDYLSVLAQMSNEALPIRRSRAIQWSGMPEYRTSVRETIAGIRQTVERLRTRLLESGLLTGSEQRAFPTVEVTVIDGRTRKMPTLRSFKWQLSEPDPKY